MGSLLTCLRAKESPGCVPPVQSQHASSQAHQRPCPRARFALLCCARVLRVWSARARSFVEMSNLSVRHSRTVIVCRRDAERHLSLSTCPKEIERDYENL